MSVDYLILTLFRYAVIACARILDKAAKREDCSVAWIIGDGAMVGRCYCGLQLIMNICACNNKKCLCRISREGIKRER